MTQEQIIKIMKNKTRVLHSKIEILDLSHNVLDEISGLVLSGQYDITNEDLVRRSITMELQYVPKFKVEANLNCLLWMNKRIRLYIGLWTPLNDVYNNGEPYWMNCGEFKIYEISSSFTTDSQTISIKAYDKMKQFESQNCDNLLLEKDTPIGEALRGMVRLLEPDALFVFDDLDYLIPYDQEYEPEDTILDKMQELIDMYMNYEIYVDINGYYHYAKMKNRIYDTPIWEFGENDPFIIDYSITYPYVEVVNYCKIIGHLDEDTGERPIKVLEITDNSNPYSIDNIGKHTDVQERDEYWTQEQVDLCAEYIMEHSKNLVNSYTINCVPIYLINDVNKVITFTHEGTKHICQLDSVSIGLGIDGTMDLTFHEIFE